MDIGHLSTKLTVLTGAGFSKNFGGYLASEIASQVRFNAAIKDKPEYYELLKSSDYMYETALAEAYESKTPEFRRTLEEAILDAYRIQNCRLCSEHRTDAWQGGFHNVRKFFKLFGPNSNGGNQDSSGFVFTLNQDLFIERHIISDTAYSMPYALPGIKGHNWFFQTYPTPITSEVNNPIQVDDTPENSEAINWKGQTNYVKLHGSSEWRNEEGELLIIGGKKEARLAKSPLLSTYLRIFKQVLFSEDRKLLVIGYSFGDNHINSIINTAIEDHGLKLWVWDYTDWVTWDRKQSSNPLAQKIDNYINTTFAEAFGGSAFGDRYDHPDLREFIN